MPRYRRIPAFIPQGGPPAAADDRAIPSRAALDLYNVYKEGWEAIGNSLYDSAAYPAAGQTQLTFFSAPIGQGTGFAGGAKTLMDTNMRLASQLPANVEFLMECIEILFLPATPTVAAHMPSFFGAQDALDQVNDAYIFYRLGNLVLLIGSKNYVEEAPLMKFPPTANFDVHSSAADATTAGAALQTRTGYGFARGRPYYLRSPMRLPSNANFTVQLNWDTAQAITDPARVYVTLGGVLYRRTQ